MRVVLSLVLAAIVVAALPVLTALILSVLARNLRRCCRSAVAFAYCQLRPLSTRRLWATALLQISALVLFALIIVGPSEPLVLAAALLIYPLFAIAMAISLLAQFPLVRAMWHDVFFKIFLVGLQLFFLYFAKGSADYWIADLWKISAVNTPVAHAAATGFSMLLCSSILLLAVVLVFDFLFLLSYLRLCKGPKRPKGQVSDAARPAVGGEPTQRPTRQRAFYRKTGQALGTLMTFIACLVAVNASLVMAGPRAASALLSAIVFDFDTVEADHCQLDKQDRERATAKLPGVKVLFLSTTQEKALVVHRGKDLYQPIVLRQINAERGVQRDLRIGPAVACYRIEADG
ncbi:hypothetical protein CAL24_04030 [Bordetella genomosp. 2]|uniref:Uncharacterized protein n=2 Tax=Bordetella genomosp. 2 TaxID=1983456 RepID=A0A261VYD0_9BORD|nr:hypothetical protein CAL24_04030 [Bordetella genomosp. 2]